MAKFGIDQAVRRVEDTRFTRGLGKYVGDLTVPRLATQSSWLRALIRAGG